MSKHSSVTRRYAIFATIRLVSLLEPTNYNAPVSSYTFGDYTQLGGIRNFYHGPVNRSQHSTHGKRKTAKHLQISEFGCDRFFNFKAYLILTCYVTTQCCWFFVHAQVALFDTRATFQLSNR